MNFTRYFWTESTECEEIQTLVTTKKAKLTVQLKIVASITSRRLPRF